MKTTIEQTMNETRERFIADHIAVCQAGPCRKYDPGKPDRGGYHTVEYARRKCAKSLWRRQQSAARPAVPPP